RLRGLKTETSEGAVSADAAIAEACARDVGAVLDDRNRMRARNLRECVEVGERRAVVHGDDGLGAARDEALDRGGIDACVGGADVGEYRSRHAGYGGIGRGGEGDRGDDDLVAGTDAERFEGDFERAGAGSRRDGEARTLIFSERGGELSGLAIWARVAAPARRGKHVFKLRAFAIVKDGPRREGAGAKGLAA